MKVNCPTAEQTRARAYQIFLERGRQSGHDIDDWLQAEYELMQLPIRKIAELDPVAIQQETTRNLRLVALVKAVEAVNRQGKQLVSRLTR